MMRGHYHATGGTSRKSLNCHNAHAERFLLRRKRRDYSAGYNMQVAEPTFSSLALYNSTAIGWRLCLSIPVAGASSQAEEISNKIHWCFFCCHTQIWSTKSLPLVVQVVCSRTVHKKWQYDKNNTDGHWGKLNNFIANIICIVKFKITQSVIWTSSNKRPCQFLGCAHVCSMFPHRLLRITVGRQQLWDIFRWKRAVRVNKRQLQSKYSIETTLWGSITDEVGSTLTAVQTLEDNAGLSKGSIPVTSRMKPDFSVCWIVLFSHDHQAWICRI